MHLVLNAAEMDAVFRQAAGTRNDGGWQSLMVGIQDNCDRATGSLTLTPDQLKRIPQYAFDYGNGGWENRLTSAFARHLGPKLGR